MAYPCAKIYPVVWDYTGSASDIFKKALRTHGIYHVADIISLIKWRLSVICTGLFNLLLLTASFTHTVPTAPLMSEATSHNVSVHTHE